MDLQQVRSNMTEQQVRPWDVLDPRVLDTLSGIPREAFVAASLRGVAYSDFALPIGHGQTLFKPTLDGRLLQSLSLKNTDTVLEIGTGSGYLTACMARLCARVESLEINAELAQAAGARLEELGIANVSVRQQDASALSLENTQAHDVIVFGGSLAAIPEQYLQALRPGGRLFAIVGTPAEPAMEAQLHTRIRDGEWRCQSLFETRVAPLRHFAPESPRFVF